MTEPSEPLWELLPHAPERFFGLSGDFDLRDLKRSYNRMIRLFKPEKFPEEFQRIRGAYESLSDALRYNVPARPPVEPPAPPDRDGAQTQEAIPPVTPIAPLPPTAPEPLFQRIASTPPGELYADLQSRPAKTPGDYVALAVLSDLAAEPGPARPEGRAFADWLFAGIAEHPNDWGLTELLREYLADELPPAQTAELLLQAVRLLPADRFQYATERAWDRVLRELPFAQFRDCLQQCQARLGRSMDHSQLVFNVHVLKLAMWKADDDFLNEMRGTVEDHFHSLAPWAQEECEMVLTLLDYRARRERFVLLGPSCERIDRAIRDWCVLPEPEGDRSVLDCQYFLSLRGQRLLDELPDYAADLSYVLVPWDRIVTDVLERVGEPEPQDQATLAGYAREFMIRILRRKQRTSGHYLGLGLVFVALALLLVTLVTSGSFAVRLCCRLFGEGRFLSSFLDGLLAAGTLLGGFCASVIVFLIGRRKAALDYGMARREVLKLIRVAPLPVDQLATIIEEREDEKYGDDQTIDDTQKITPRMRRDAAIELFSQAQRCLHAADPEPVVQAVAVDADPKAPSRPVRRRLT